MTLRLAGAELRGFAAPIEEKMPYLAKMYNVTLTQSKRPDRAPVEAAVNTQVVVRVTLEDGQLAA